MHLYTKCLCLIVAEELGGDGVASADAGAVVEDIRRFSAIDMIRNAAAGTATVSLTGKGLLILVLVMANILMVMMLVYRCTKCCGGNKVKYEVVGVLSEGTDDEMNQMDDEMRQMIQ